MNRRRRILMTVTLCLCLALGLLQGGCELPAPVEQPPQTETPAADTAEPASAYSQIAKVGDELPVSRALAAKMLALALLDRQAVDGLDREMTFTDVDRGAWYDRYVNACVWLGLMTGGGGEFLPENPLTLVQAQTLLDRLNPENELQIQLTDENRDKPISYALWVDLYMQTLEAMAEDGMYAGFGVAAETAVILVTAESNPLLPEGYTITADGPLPCAGLRMDAYADKEVLLLRKKDEVLAVVGITSAQPTLRGAYVVRQGAGDITVFLGGAERTYTCDGVPEITSVICDIQIDGGRVVKQTPLTEAVTGTLKRLSAGEVELDGTGVFSASGTMRVYAAESAGRDAAVMPKWKNLQALTVGTDGARFYLRNGVIAAAVLDKAPSAESIRVVLGTTGFDGYVHKEVSITGDMGFTLRQNETELFFAPGEALVLPADGVDADARMTLTPEAGGRLTAESIRRAWPGDAAPSYRGVLEIAAADDGEGYILVNELPLEEYLYAVVPSEMPSAYGLDPSKVQAITARSYAYNQLRANRYHRYGANVDDSVACQVYNNMPETDISIQAVDETAGLCLAYRGKVVSANYFSTSAGVTANAGEVWPDNLTHGFPGNTPEYLQSLPQVTSVAAVKVGHDALIVLPSANLTQEENAASFFKDQTVEAHDSAFPWFRWTVTAPADALSANINRVLQTRYAANPQLIKTVQADGRAVSRAIDGIGTLEDIKVISRGEGGNVTCLRLTGSDASVLVYTEYNIRTLLAPVGIGGEDIFITRKDGTVVANYALLPSAFFTLDAQRNDDGSLVSVTFHGGGNGHGVGMSQNGVKGMMDAGATVAGALAHFYPGSEVIDIRN